MPLPVPVMRVLIMRRVIWMTVLVTLPVVSACTRGRPVNIVHADQSAVVGTLVSMRPDIVEIETPDGVLVSEPRAGIASITAPSEPEIAALRTAERARGGGGDEAGAQGRGGSLGRPDDPERKGPFDDDPGGGASARRDNPGAGAGGANAGAGGPAGGSNAGGTSAGASGGGRFNGPPNMASNTVPPPSGGRANAANGANDAAGPSGSSSPGSGSPGSGSSGSGSPGSGSPGSARLAGIVIPAGRVLALSLDTPLDSDSSRVEERVEATLAAPVVLMGGAQALPAGTRLRGDVTEAVSAKQAGGRGRLTIRFHTLVIGGDEVSIAAAPVRYVAPVLTRDDAKKVGIGAAAGAMFGRIVTKTKKGLGIGAAAGGGATALAVGLHNEMRLARGARLSVRIAEPVSLPAR